MKLKLKLLAAALGFALAGGANANVTMSATGSGELFFTIYDVGADLSSSADDRAYVRDLGTLTNGSLAGGTLSNWTVGTGTSPAPVLNPAMLLPATPGFNVAADANLSSFLAGSSDLSRLRWNVAAADSSGTDRFLITADSISAAQTPNYNIFRTFAQNGADVYLAQINPFLGANDSAIVNGAAASINLWGNNVGGRAAFSTSAGLGGSLNFFLLSEKVATGSTTTLATVQQFEQWQLSNDGTLIYAPVPEPGTWAMLAAGLLMIGGIARRRMSV